MTDSVHGILADLAQATHPFAVAGSPFRHAHQFSSPATDDEVERAWAGRSLAGQLLALWAEAREIELFVDVDFGQWGLRLLSPGTSATRTDQERSARPDDFNDGDVVLGEFLGDLELLVIDRAGIVIVALPLDEREDWPRVAEDLASFLVRYSAAHLDKYWEEPGWPGHGV